MYSHEGIIAHGATDDESFPPSPFPLWRLAFLACEGLRPAPFYMSEENTWRKCSTHFEHKSQSSIDSVCA